MKRIFLAIFICIISFQIVGAAVTAQIPDKLWIGDPEYDLYSNPLEDFYSEDRSKRPRFWAGNKTTSSGINRGYIATWEIIDSKLYLVEIDSWFCFESGTEECRKVELSDILRHTSSGKEGHFAKWFTGTLRVPSGKQLLYVHNGYHSIFERDQMIEIKAGKITGEKIVDNTNKPLPMEQGVVPNEVYAKPRAILRKKTEPTRLVTPQILSTIIAVFFVRSTHRRFSQAR